MQQTASTRIAFVMDDISAINTKKDSTFAMMLEAQRRQWPIFYLQQQDIWFVDGVVYAFMTPVEVRDNNYDWYSLGEPVEQPLQAVDAVFMRKDPPFDMEYVYSTYLLEMAQSQGVLVVNRPESVRSANEKLFAGWFPKWCPETCVTRDMSRINRFLQQHNHIVVKPLDGMGGSMVFHVKEQDPNRNVILETITAHGTRTVMAQRFLPEYREGDKRILLINGEPFPHALARIPAEGEGRANLAAGATSKGVDLTEREWEICAAIGPVLKEKGLLFVGLDVIGDWVTEINVTSPTCIRELDTIYEANIAGLLMDALEEHL